MLKISATLDGQCAVLTLNRPEALNALNAPLLDAFEAALDEIASDEQRRALIVAGTGRAFCAGADLKESLDDPMVRVRRMHELVLRLRDFPKISVAAIDGHALGGGLELAMACTFRVAGPKALLGLPEIRMNLIPGFGGTQLLPRLVGTARALEMLLSGEPVDAKQALAMGLVNVVTDDADSAVNTAEQLVRRCAGHGLEAQQAMRAAVYGGASLPLEEALALEREHVARIGASASGKNGVSNFREGGRH